MMTKQKTFLAMSRNINNFSYFQINKKNHLHSSVDYAKSSKSTKVHKNTLQTHKPTGPQTYKGLYVRWQALPPTSAPRPTLPEYISL